MPARTLWLLKHCRTGDLRQMRHFAGLLGKDWEVEEKQLNFTLRAFAYLPGMTPFSVNQRRSSLLSPPWPSAMVMAEALVGKVALALKRAGAHDTKLIVLGRPAGGVASFDLVLTTRQYGIPVRPNVQELPVPLAVPPSAAAEDRDELKKLMKQYPRPWVALLIGGSVAPDILDPSAATALATAALSMARAIRGSLFAVSSPRTGEKLESQFRQLFAGANARMFASRGEERNFYPAILAEADRFLVTSDSVSMVIEAMNTQKPVTVFGLPQRFPPALKLVKTLAAGKMLAPLFGFGILEVPADRAAYFKMLESRNAISIYPREPLGGPQKLLEEAERLTREAVERLFA